MHSVGEIAKLSRVNLVIYMQIKIPRELLRFLIFFGIFFVHINSFAFGAGNVWFPDLGNYWELCVQSNLKSAFRHNLRKTRFSVDHVNKMIFVYSDKSTDCLGRRLEIKWHYNDDYNWALDMRPCGRPPIIIQVMGDASKFVFTRSDYRLKIQYKSDASSLGSSSESIVDSPDSHVIWTEEVSDVKYRLKFTSSSPNGGAKNEIEYVLRRENRADIFADEVYKLNGKPTVFSVWLKAYMPLYDSYFDLANQLMELPPESRE